jgi:hypothetical protein
MYKLVTMRLGVISINVHAPLYINAPNKAYYTSMRLYEVPLYDTRLSGVRLPTTPPKKYSSL